MSKFKVSFIGIGGPRCATTWISRCIDEHPELCMADIKETNYFNKNIFWTKLGNRQFQCGFDWYRDRWNHAKGNQLICEITPSYLYNKESAVLIKSAFPDVKLLAVVRNPIDIVYSLIFQLRKKGLSFGTPIEILHDNPGIFKAGFMYEGIKWFNEHFLTSQLLIMNYDDIKVDSIGFIRKIYAHIGVDADFLPPSVDIVVNPSHEIKFDVLGKINVAVRIFLNSGPITRTVRDVLEKLFIEKVANFLLKANRKSGGKIPAMDLELQTMLTEMYEQEIINLECLIGKKLRSKFLLPS